MKKPIEAFAVVRNGKILSTVGDDGHSDWLHVFPAKWQAECAATRKRDRVVRLVEAKEDTP